VKGGQKKMENKTVGIIISVGVAVLIGIVLVQIIAETTAPVTTKAVTTDTLNIAGARNNGLLSINASKGYNASDILTYPASTSWKTDYADCAITSIRMKNQTGGILTDGVDYNWVDDGSRARGSLSLVNTLNLNTSLSNTTTITYDYCTEDYLAEGWGRTVLNMVPGFFALAILIGVAFVIFWILKKEGIEMDI
jgi:hypothetical protein